MKLLSIDIGIKNMGICLFEIIDNSFNIIEWKILDLLCVHKCTIETCSKPVKFYKNNEYYCKVHAKKHDIFYIPPDDLTNINKIKNYKVSDLHELCNNHDISYNTPITKNEIISDSGGSQSVTLSSITNHSLLRWTAGFRPTKQHRKT